MSTTQTQRTTSRLVQAIEARDADEILTHYAEDATLLVLDKDHPPSNPQTITGLAAIGDYYRDVCGRNLQHEVRDVLDTAGGLAYTQRCRYPDGTQVVCATVATVRDGLIISQTAVQTWDV